MEKELLKRGTRVNVNGGIDNGTIVKHYHEGIYEVMVWSNDRCVGQIASSEFTICMPEQLNQHKSA